MYSVYDVMYCIMVVRPLKLLSFGRYRSNFMTPSDVTCMREEKGMMEGNGKMERNEE